ncbi:MAG: DUF2334 domain-containing protein [Fibrobacterota bacterium]|nr:DUF2334 domain-containing protein [Fibrobacterota bacterium]
MATAASVRKLVISLHDATPFHLERIRRAEVVFQELGIGKVTYLFVPEYHGSYPSVEHPGFAEWCRSPRSFRIDWHLHGYHHLETPAFKDSSVTYGAGRSGLGDFFKRKLMTAGEGEFQALDSHSQREKLVAGRDAFRRCLQVDPTGFVAPAWLFNPALTPLLKEMGFQYTEDHRRIYRVDMGSSLESPVITWATRTFLRKYGSLAVCPTLARLWSDSPVVRVAMHPFDFDHASTTANIKSVLRRLIKCREQAFSGDLEFPAAVAP